MDQGNWATIEAFNILMQITKLEAVNIDLSGSFMEN